MTIVFRAFEGEQLSEIAQRGSKSDNLKGLVRFFNIGNEEALFDNVVGYFIYQDSALIILPKFLEAADLEQSKDLLRTHSELLNLFSINQFYEMDTELTRYEVAGSKIYLSPFDIELEIILRKVSAFVAGNQSSRFLSEEQSGYVVRGQLDLIKTFEASGDNAIPVSYVMDELHSEHDLTRYFRAWACRVQRYIRSNNGEGNLRATCNSHLDNIYSLIGGPLECDSKQLLQELAATCLLSIDVVHWTDIFNLANSFWDRLDSIGDTRGFGYQISMDKFFEAITCELLMSSPGAISDVQEQKTIGYLGGSVWKSRNLSVRTPLASKATALRVQPDLMFECSSIRFVADCKYKIFPFGKQNDSVQALGADDRNQMISYYLSAIAQPDHGMQGPALVIFFVDDRVYMASDRPDNTLLYLEFPNLYAKDDGIHSSSSGDSCLKIYLIPLRLRHLATNSGAKRTESAAVKEMLEHIAMLESGLATDGTTKVA